jgi:hypothetical protein
MNRSFNPYFGKTKDDIELDKSNRENYCGKKRRSFPTLWEQNKLKLLRNSASLIKVLN